MELLAKESIDGEEVLARDGVAKEMPAREGFTRSVCCCQFLPRHAMICQGYAKTCQGYTSTCQRCVTQDGLVCQGDARDGDVQRGVA